LFADVENGGVMMNEFSPKYLDVVREASGSDTPFMNVSGYVEQAAGVGSEDFDYSADLSEASLGPTRAGCWPRYARDRDELRKEDSRFHVEVGSWTNNISWVLGYDALLGPMERVSSLFFEKVLQSGVSSTEHRYRNARRSGAPDAIHRRHW
jgi:hypothetical protein